MMTMRFKSVFLIGLFLSLNLSCKKVSSFLKGDSPAKSAAEYTAECKAAGVAIPQPIENRNFWNQDVRSINLNYPHFAAGDGSGGKRYVHQAPQDSSSGCLELISDSRSFGESNEQVKTTAFAICWSRDGAVCFWEQAGVSKEELSTTFKIAESESATPYSQEYNNCLRCHVGENPFVGHGEHGDPAFGEFPYAKFTKPIVPPNWISDAKWEVNPKGEESYQCGGACHTIPRLEENNAFCQLGMSFNYAGLMLGKKFKLENPASQNGNQDTKTASNSVPLESLDEETRLQCKQWISFIQACGNTKVKQKDIGICPLPTESDSKTDKTQTSGGENKTDNPDKPTTSLSCKFENSSGGIKDESGNLKGKVNISNGGYSISEIKNYCGQCGMSIVSSIKNSSGGYSDYCK